MKLPLFIASLLLLLLTHNGLSERGSSQPQRYRLSDVADRIAARFYPTARRYIEVLLDAPTSETRGETLVRDNCMRLDEDLLQSYGPVQVQSEVCPYVILALNGYYYKPGTNMSYIMLPKKSSYEFTSYNIEFVDSIGNPVGEMIEGNYPESRIFYWIRKSSPYRPTPLSLTLEELFIHYQSATGFTNVEGYKMTVKGDTICDEGRYISRDLYAGSGAGYTAINFDVEKFHRVIFVWRSPEKDIGEVKMRYTVGRQLRSGSHDLWKDCGALLSNHMKLKYVESIPPPIRDVPVEITPSRTPNHEENVLVERDEMSDRGVEDGFGSCSRSGILYTVTPNSKCNRYSVSPGGDEFSCSTSLVFDVVECVCSYPRYGKKCHV